LRCVGHLSYGFDARRDVADNKVKAVKKRKRWGGGSLYQRRPCWGGEEALQGIDTLLHSEIMASRKKRERVFPLRIKGERKRGEKRVGHKKNLFHENRTRWNEVGRSGPILFGERKKKEKGATLPIGQKGKRSWRGPGPSKGAQGGTVRSISRPIRGGATSPIKREKPVFARWRTQQS